MVDFYGELKVFSVLLHVFVRVIGANFYYQPHAARDTQKSYPHARLHRGNVQVHIFVVASAVPEICFLYFALSRPRQPNPILLVVSGGERIFA
jgi:hypothetical protein